jgi:hypothetical protein
MIDARRDLDITSHPAAIRCPLNPKNNEGKRRAGSIKLAIELPGAERDPNIPAPVERRLPSLRCCVGRDYDPVQGKWYQDLEENEIFLVLSVDPDEEIVELQYENGDIEEIDLDTWHELDLEHATEPEGWANDDDEEEEEEEELEEDDDDWDEDEDDDWDEDEDDDDLDDRDV